MDERVRLDDLLCFDLYSASHAMTAWYRPMLEELGLTYAQYLVLVVLWDRDRLPIKDIAESLRLDYGTLTPMLRRMETAGLVTRTRRTDDERSVAISLTPRARSLEARGREVHRCLRDALGLTVEEAGVLQRALRSLSTAARAEVPATA